MKQAVTTLALPLLLSLLLSLPGFSAFSAPAVLAADDVEPAGVVVEQVDINSADAATIATALTGVGVKKAEAIVAWRTANGRFESVDQLLEVKGIGPAILARNRDKLQAK